MEQFEDCEAWFSEVCAGYEFFVEGDDLGSTFISSGAVLLLMAKLDTSSPSLLSSISGLPAEFTAGVVQCVDRKSFRHSEYFKDLEQTVEGDTPDLAEIRSCLECALEHFWLSVDPKRTGGLMC